MKINMKLLLIFFPLLLIIWLFYNNNIYNIIFSSILLFFPGYLLLIIFFKKIEKSFYIFSIGLSIVLITLATLLWDFFADYLNINDPLNRLYIGIIYIILIFCELLICKIKNISLSINIEKINKETLFIIIYYINLLFFIILFSKFFMHTNFIPIIVCLILIGFFYVYNNKKISYFPLLIFLIGINLITLYSIKSDFIMGKDIFNEYWHFKGIYNESDWYILFNGNSLLSGTLSVNLLPVIISNISQINNQIIFKYIIPVIFVLSAISVYYICKKFLENKHAFLGSLIFFTAPAFLISPWSPRTIIAIFFVSLILLLLINYQSNKHFTLIFLLLSFGVISSHYSTTYILLSILIIAFIFNKIYKINNPLNFKLIIIFVIMSYLWYTLISIKSFEGGISGINNLITHLNELFIQNSRSDEVITSTTGSNVKFGFLSYIHLIINWIIVGLFSLTTIYILIKSLKRKEVKRKISSLSISILIILIFVTILPQLSIFYDLQRTYLLGSIIIPCIVILGYKQLLHDKKWNIMIILICLSLLFKIGVIYYYTDNNSTLQLSNSNDDINRFYIITTEEYYSSSWIDKYNNDMIINSDRSFMIKLSFRPDLNETYISNINKINNSNYDDLNGLIFIDRNNIYGLVKDNFKSPYILSNMTTYIHNNDNLIYNNLGSKVYIRD